VASSTGFDGINLFGINLFGIKVPDCNALELQYLVYLFA
jgi:hypothetical protein